MVLAIDYGRRHIGLAIGDKETKVAMPYKTLQRETSDQIFRELSELIVREGIVELVVGLPATTQDRASEMTEEAEQFSVQLASRTQKPVQLVDERFTSAGARVLCQENSKADEHALAAMLILQTYFDRLESDRRISNEH